MWVPFQLSKKARGEGPHYAGYNERAIATTLDLILFLFFMLRPIFWAEQKIRSYFEPYVDMGVFQRLEPHAHALDFMQQVQLAFRGFIESGIWKVFLATNGMAIVVVLIIYAACMIIFHTTPGKWIMGIKVTRADHVSRPYNWQIIVRSFAALVSCMPLMLGVFWMMFDKESRTWHDMIAGTRVITTRPDGWYWNKIKQAFRWLRTQIQGPPPPEEPPTTPHG